MESKRSIPRRSLMAVAAAGLLLPDRRTSAAGQPVLRVGHLTDISGPYSATTGPTSIVCSQQAVIDFDRAAHGMQVELLTAFRPMSEGGCPYLHGATD